MSSLLMTGRSISRPTSSRSLKPSMSGMFTSLITMSKPSFLSRSRSKASLAKLQVITETPKKNKTLEKDQKTYRRFLKSRRKGCQVECRYIKPKAWSGKVLTMQNMSRERVVCELQINFMACWEQAGLFCTSSTMAT